MKSYILILLSLFMTAPAVASQPLDIQVVKEKNDTLRFQRIVANRTDTEIRVHGRVTANRAQLLPKGHVDIAAYASDGTLISTTTAAISPKTLSRHSKRQGGVRFTGIVAGATPKDATIKITYHRLDEAGNDPNHLPSASQQ